MKRKLNQKKNAKGRQSTKRFRSGAIGVIVVIAAVFAVFVWNRGPHVARKASEDTRSDAAEEPGFKQPATFLELCNTPSDQLEKCDIALLNLLCAEGLPGAENLNVCETLERLDGIAQGVKFEIDRHIYKFRQNPTGFKNNEGYYRMMMMATVLQQDLGIRYNPERIQMPSQPLESNERFFANSEDVFIHGLAQKNGMGTCSSMPVFYVAVGRRLGYPLKLVTAKGHIFARWEEGAKSFNIEGTTVGFGSYPDDHYRTWPARFTPEEQEREGFLKPLTPVQELAVFLSIRGQCLRAAKDYKKALGAFAHAVYRQPKPISHQALFALAEREAFEAGVLPKRNALRYAVQSLEIPAGPHQALHVMERAELLRMLEDTNINDGDIQRRFDRLQAQIVAATARRTL